MENKRVGIIAVLIALIGFGGGQTLTSDQLSNAYVCPLTEEVGVFPDGLSSSGKTGYYIDSVGDRHSVSCNEGRTYEPWVPLKDYAESQGVSITEILNVPVITENVTIVPVKGTQGVYECDISGGVLETYTLCQKDGREVYAGELLIPAR